MLTDLSKGDMQAAENLGDDDIEVSEDEAGEEDKMSLASDLDEEDLEEVEKRQMELEQKAGKKKLVNLKVQILSCTSDTGSLWTVGRLHSDMKTQF